MALLEDVLTEASYEELVKAAARKTKAEVQALLARHSPKPDVRAAIVPLSERRHKVQFTATEELRKKLERAQDLMRHANADGDLAVVVERAVDLLLEKLEKQRLGKAACPRQSRQDGNPGTVSRATRREVFERDGERCTFVDADGHRCPATTWLELDHVVPRGRGGTSDLANLRVRCRAHNLLYAEQTFGKQHVERKIRERRDPRQRGSLSDSYALAASGLVNLGFRRADVLRALDAVYARHGAEVLATLPVQSILREALALLT